MKCFDLKGRPANIKVADYSIDWDKKVSLPQYECKQFLRPYWKDDVVCEEMRLPKSLLRIDLTNWNKRIVVEVSPPHHTTFSPFFHRSLAGYRASIKRDLDKVKWAELNGFLFIEITDDDLPLSPKWFLEKHQVTL